MDASKRTPLTAALFFIACAIADSCWGYLHSKSLSDALFSVVLGLFGTTIFFKTMFRKDNVPKG